MTAMAGGNAGAVVWIMLGFGAALTLAMAVFFVVVLRRKDD